LTVPQLSPNLVTAIVLLCAFLTAALTLSRWNEHVQKDIDKTRIRITEYLPKADILHLSEVNAEFGSLHEVIVKQERMKIELTTSTWLVLLAPFLGLVPLLVIFVNEEVFPNLASPLYLVTAILVIAAYALTSIARSTLHDLTCRNPAIHKGRARKAEKAAQNDTTR